MCGVFGWVNFRRALHEDEVAQARNALGLLKHRGPDFQGEWRIGNVYLGHRRLSIIDLSPQAHQPFVDEHERFVLSFNGEIYNYIELREDLKRSGCRFRSLSDTEVLLQSFKTWGKEAFLKFDGMFAGVIYDRKLSCQYLFRDHLGQKPPVLF